MDLKYSNSIKLRSVFLITADDSNSIVLVFELSVPLGQKLPAPAHKNDAYEETLYGIEGFLTWTVDGTPIEVGRKAAMEMLVTGREFLAAEAKSLGLVNRVVPLEKLEATTRDLARQIAEASGFALSIGKQGLYAQADMSDTQALHYAKHTIVMNNMAEDAQNGIKAFLEKRTPEWKNR